MANPFLKIRKSVGDDKKSLQWYQDQIKGLAEGSIRPNKLMQSTDLTTNILPGKMYMFFYDAKFKDVLPYWDRFPLVLPFRTVPGGFYGINLHYLPYDLRFKLLSVLHDQGNDKKLSEDARIKIAWSTLSRLSSIAPIEACVKHYLYDHVQSKFLNIKYPDWVTAALLPVERFQGARKQRVWQDSRKRV